MEKARLYRAGRLDIWAIHDGSSSSSSTTLLLGYAMMERTQSVCCPLDSSVSDCIFATRKTKLDAANIQQQLYIMSTRDLNKSNLPTVLEKVTTTT